MKELSHPSLHRTWVEIDLGAIIANVRYFRETVSAACQIMPSVMADAYGHGSVEVSRAALAGGATRLAVATCREGQTLREAGIGVPIQVLGASLPEEIETAVRYNLTLSLQDLETARLVAVTAMHHGRVAPVQIEIDTGERRLGFLPESAVAAACEIAGFPGMVFEGAFTRLAEASDRDRSLRQLGEFTRACHEIEDAGITGFMRHAANSASTLLHPESHLDLVRPGCGVLGFLPQTCAGLSSVLRPAMSWRAAIVLLKDFPSGDAPARRVAVLPVGYADGYQPEFSRRARVLIRGKRVPVVDAVSMDYTLVDVTGVDGLTPGTVATLMGEDRGERIGIQELSAWGEVTPSELTVGIGGRVGRQYAAN